MSRAGSKLGPYRLHELINSGGMSEIWLATDDAGTSYAVRLLLNSSPFAFTERKRFNTGCEVLQAVQGHDLMIGYVEHGKIGGELCLVMEYVEGSNLKLLLNEQNPVLAENLAQILIDMAVALEHLHDHGFMHLDFKPENVLLTRNGSLRLIDFDLAQPIPNPPRKLEKNPGTPAYMAPEQLLRQPVDHRRGMDQRALRGGAFRRAVSRFAGWSLVGRDRGCDAGQEGDPRFEGGHHHRICGLISS